MLTFSLDNSLFTNLHYHDINVIGTYPHLHTSVAFPQCYLLQAYQLPSYYHT